MEHISFIKLFGFLPKENHDNIYCKHYPQHDNYTIEVDFNKKSISYGSLLKSENKTTQNFAQAENWVVLECVNRLLEKGYKPQNIILEKTWSAGHGTSGRLDICVNRDDKTNSEFMLIECKTFGKEFEKAFARMSKDGGQLFTYFKFSNKADVIMLYASELKGNEILFSNEIIKIEEDYRQGDVKDFYDKWNKLAKDNGVFDSWVNPYIFESKSLVFKELKDMNTEDSGFIFNRFLEILRHNVVSDKPNAFNKIFTLFLCKIYDEKQCEETDNELKFQWIEGIDTHETFQLRLSDLYKDGMKAFLDKNVTDFSEEEFEQKYKTLDPSVKKPLLEEFKRIRLEKNNEFAVKEVYDKNSFEENAIVVKQIVELLQGYKIRYAKKQQYLSDFFELLLTTGLKQESGQFFTPVPIAQFIIKSLPIDQIVQAKLSSNKRGELLPYIIDYAAGSGHFITESMNEIQKILDKDNSIRNGESKKLIEMSNIAPFDWAYDYTYGIEKDYRLVKVGKVGCYLHGDGLANVIHSDGLSKFGTNDYKGKLTISDSNFPKENKQFDIVVSNPPYSVPAFKNASRQYYSSDDFELYNFLTDNSSEIECLFIERTKQLLKDGGVAGIILPSSILSNSGIYAKAREIIFKYFEILSITVLGSNTFMATNTNTVVLFLRRRNNYENINLLKSVSDFFTSHKEVTLNGVEKAITKYISHVWEDISFDDYISLLKATPSEKISEHELYVEYTKKLKSKNNAEFFKKVLEIEQEKLFYFVLSYPQQVVIVNSGDKDVEKRFLGYEFSNRRGSEGIHPVERGKSIDECTQLFDPESYVNPAKTSTYIYQAFSGDFSSEIDESLVNHVSRVSLVDLLTFDRSDFDKTISTSAKKKVKFEQVWATDKLVFLSDVAKIQKGTSITKEKTKEGNIPVIAGGKDVAYFHNQSNRKGNVITISASGAYAGFVNHFNDPIFASDCNTIQSLNENTFRTKVLYEFLKNIQDVIYSLQKGQAQPHVYGEDLSKIKIPLPPMDVQNKIVDEITIIETQCNTKKEHINELKIQLNNSLNLETYPNDKLENISTLLKRGKSAKYGNSEIQIIKSGQARGYREFNFEKKHYVDNNFILDERKLEKGDILINSTGVGTAGRVTLFDLDETFVVDTHITILRLEKEMALPIYVLYALANGIGFKNIEAMAHGQSGQIELSIPIIQNIKIPIPPIAEQQKIVDKIEAIELQIIEAQKVIDNAPSQKQNILTKYL